MTLRRCVWLRRIAASLIAGGACLAQPQPVVRGRFADSHNRPIPNAKVTVTALNFSATATTDSEGRFAAAQVPRPFTVSVREDLFEEFRTTFQGSLSRPEFHFSAILRPTPVDGSEMVIFTISDAASGRPQYLPASGIGQGAPIVLTGIFRASETVRSNETPPPFGLNGYSVKFSSDEDELIARIFSVAPDRIAAQVPADLPAGTWNVNVINGDRASRGASVAVIDSGIDIEHPHVFTHNELGFGTAAATNEAGDDITFLNPARPGGVVDLKVVAPRGANQVYSISFFGRGRVPAALSPDPASTGVSIARITVPADFASSQTSCAVPFQISAANSNGDVRFGNQAALPVSNSGPCTDALGFGAADFPRLRDRGIRIVEASITEATLLSVPQTNRVAGQLQATHWTYASYGGVAPVDTCSYRWEPYEFRNPNAPARLAIEGTATATVPWGVFNFSPSSNAGPYSLLFTNPLNFTTGNYSLNFPAGFSIARAAHTFQTSGVYDRPAGRVREFVARRAEQAGSGGGQSLSKTIDQVIQSIIDAPRSDLSRIFADFNITADDGTLGRHFIRCVADPANLQPGMLNGIPTNGLFSGLIPDRTNRTDLIARFFPREQIQSSHTNSGADRTHATFDAIVVVQDIDGNR